MADERSEAMRLANQIMRDSHELEWLKPLASEYLKTMARDRATLPERKEEADG